MLRQSSTSTTVNTSSNIITTGSIGIGSASPSNKLDVVGSGRSVTLLSGNSSSGVGTTISKGYSPGHAYSLLTSGGVGTGLPPSGTFAIYDEDNLATRVAVDSSGHVGIGTTTPSAALDVYGYFTARSSATPTIVSCGSGGSIVGSDNSFQITLGSSGLASTCTIGFAATWSTPPASCTISPGRSTAAGFLTSTYISSISTTQLVIGIATGAASAPYYIQCF